MNRILFITGFRRSGTSLMKAILGSHPQIHMIPEEINIDKIEDIKDIQIPSDQMIGLKRNTYIRDINSIRSVYPNSKFIFMIRDSRACIASQKTYNISHNNSYNARSTLNLCRMWNKDLYYYHNAKDVMNEDIIKVKYEHLVMSPKTILKGVCDFLDIDYDDCILNFKDRWEHGLLDGYTSYPDETIDDGRIYTSSINKWQSILSEKEILGIESFNRKYLIQEGYMDDKSV